MQIILSLNQILSQIFLNLVPLTIQTSPQMKKREIKIRIKKIKL